MSISSISSRPSIAPSSSISRPEPRPEVRSPAQSSSVQQPFARDCFESGCCKGGPDLQGGVDKAQTPEQLKKLLGQMLGQVLEQLGFKREDIDQAMKSLGLGEQASAQGGCGPGADAGKAGGACGAGAPSSGGSCGGADGNKPMSLEELLKMLMQNPALLKQVLQNPQLLQQLMQNPEAAQQSNKSASPIGELSGVSRFMSPQSFQIAA